MPALITPPRTLYDKLFDSHVVKAGKDGTDTLLYCDRHLVHEVTSPQAFEGLRQSGRKVRRPELTLATTDHNVPTDSRKDFKGSAAYISDPGSRAQVAQMVKNVREFDVSFFGLDDKRQGIIHIIGTEQGFVLPGTVVVCGDSHTSTHGAFGALGFGLGTSEVEHVLATQTIPQNKSKNMRISIDGPLSLGVTSKDVILNIIRLIGTAGGTGCCIEYCGTTVEEMSMEARMSMCNMSIEGGARAGIVAPDAKTLAYLRGRPLCPTGQDWEDAVAYWQTLKSDQGARYDIELRIDAKDIGPSVTWGTSPQDVVLITGSVPLLSSVSEGQRADMRKSLAYMGLAEGTPMRDISIDKAFLGSCTNSRIEDLRSGADVILASLSNGGPSRVAPGVQAMVVPGSGLVKRQAEDEGLDIIFRRAGFDWREAGCSMCLGMNADALKPRERCASTSNRNFEGRQGAGGRTHLMSPGMVVAAALTGKLADVRELLGQTVKDTSKQRNFLDYLEPISLSMNPTERDRAASADQPKASPTSVSPKTAGLPKFTVVKGVAVPFEDSNIDTDGIVPKQFLKTLSRTGLGTALFFPLRYDPKTGEEIPDFVLNREPYRSAKLLVCTGQNFAIGSAREHAAWSFNDFGIRCIIAPSLGEIFTNNCYKNGMLALPLPQSDVDALHADAVAGSTLSVDLEQNLIFRDKGEPIPFEIDPFRRYCLLNGLDDIALTLEHESLIGEYERRRVIEWPWLRERNMGAIREDREALRSSQEKAGGLEW